jgi:nucleoside-diphosphate kinase
LVERSLILLKPETVKRRLIGEVLRRIEREGFDILAMKMMKLSIERAQRLYEVHAGKPFYDNLIKHITSGPVVVAVVQGEGAIKALRRLIGVTDPSKAERGTIRGDLGLNITENIVHASDNEEIAEKEISMFFSEEEVSNREQI